MERSNDETLYRGLQVWHQSKLGHALAKNLVVGAITPTATLHATLSVKFFERLVKPQNRVSRRCVPELAVFLEAFKLINEVQAQAARLTGASCERFAPAQHETKPGYAFQTFVWGRNQVINSAFLKIDWDRPEA